MADETERFEIQPIGIMHSDIVDHRMIPPNGVPAVVEVVEEFQDGLLLVWRLAARHRARPAPDRAPRLRAAAPPARAAAPVPASCRWRASTAIGRPSRTKHRGF
jgi:hypothetical protein